MSSSSLFSSREKWYHLMIINVIISVTLIVLCRHKHESWDMRRCSSRADQLETSTPRFVPPGKARALELLKIGLFNPPPLWVKIVFKCPTLSSGLSVQCSNDESMAEFRFFNEDIYEIAEQMPLPDKRATYNG